MNTFVKKLVSGIAALTMCLSVAPIGASAATTYTQGDINGDGTVNSADALILNKFLKGTVYASNSNTTQRLDVNQDYIIDQNDYTVVKNIVLGTASSSTITYTSASSLPTSTSRTYYKYNPTSGSYKGSYTLSKGSSISTTSSSASTRTIMGGFDDRWAEDGLDGVINIQTSNGSNVGTAFVVDDHTMLTAAHCLYDDDASAIMTGLKFKVFSDYDTESNVTITPVEYQIAEQYINSSSSYYDYAIITVEEDLSQYINFNVGVVRNELYTTSASSKKLLFITGFGGAGNSDDDKQAIIDSGTQNLIHTKSTGDGFLTSTPTSYKLDYDVDTVGGDSGAPVYAFINGQKTVIGIHTNAGNSGIRITTDILNLIYNHS